MDDGPIREEKTLFEKFRDKFSGGRRKKIFITTYNPYTNKEQKHVIGTYLSKDEERIKEKLQENLSNLTKAINKSGMTARELQENISRNIKEGKI